MFDNVTVFFSKLFARIIFENKIVATILNNISKQIRDFNWKIDEVLDTDI